MKIKKIVVSCMMLYAGTWFSIGADDDKDVNKNITVITGQSTADGKSTVSKEILEECIVSLPNASSLEPQVTSKNTYLKEINGDQAKNDFVKTYTATLEINYMVRQKELIIITTNSIQKQEPVTKIFDKQVREQKKFVSDPSETGDLYAGKSNKEYYFTTADAAKKDVQKRAAAWLTQQANVVCTGNRNGAGK